MEILKFDSSHINDIIVHFLSLSAQDRYLRFAHSPTDEQIRRYISESIVKKDDHWFGCLYQGKIVGSIHVSIGSGVAEFGLTTDPIYRGQKIGQRLFGCGYELVISQGIEQIYLACLSTNRPMRHIAKKFGLAVISHGPETEASVTISYPVPLNRINEIKASIIDKNIGKDNSNDCKI